LFSWHCILFYIFNFPLAELEHKAFKSMVVQLHASFVQHSEDIPLGKTFSSITASVKGGVKLAKQRDVAALRSQIVALGSTITTVQDTQAKAAKLGLAQHNSLKSDIKTAQSTLATVQSTVKSNTESIAKMDSILSDLKTSVASDAQSAAAAAAAASSSREDQTKLVCRI
jgi:septal ring factor EnvC (AmiA/AmiB activator)